MHFPFAQVVRKFESCIWAHSSGLAGLLHTVDLKICTIGHAVFWSPHAWNIFRFVFLIFDHRWPLMVLIGLSTVFMQFRALGLVFQPLMELWLLTDIDIVDTAVPGGEIFTFREFPIGLGPRGRLLRIFDVKIEFCPSGLGQVRATTILVVRNRASF